MKELNPLYELLANIVHMEYANPQHAIQEIIPGQLKGVLYLFESAGIETEQKEKMKESVMWYIYENRRFFDDFNKGGDYSDELYLHIIIHRFQVDAERTRIYLEVWERDKETKMDYLALDF